jgi:hypothetical protein
MPLSESELWQTAKELRAQVRQRAGLATNWEKMSEGMRAWYLLLARRAEGLEEKLQ